jgi:putative transcriptional regulator
MYISFVYFFDDETNITNMLYYNGFVIIFIKIYTEFPSVDVQEKLIRLGLKVKELREEKGLSQTELAYKIGKDQPSINRLEKGKVNPSIIYLLQICEGLEISIEELFNSL